MPDEKFHIWQAKHNNTFLTQIESTIFFDWITTVMFYEALHYIDFFLSKKNQHPQGHPERSNAVARFLGAVYKSYRDLEIFSYIARYQPDIWQSQIDKTKIVELKKELDKIRSFGATFKIP